MKNTKRQNRTMEATGIFLMVFSIKFLPLDLATKQDWLIFVLAILGFITYVYGVKE